MKFDTFDASYIEQLRSGDEAASEHFVRYFSELIVLKLRSKLLSAQEIEIVRNETFARTLTLLRSEEGPSHEKRLGAVVDSICNSILLERYHLPTRIDPLQNTLASGEMRDKVRQVLGTLSRRDRAVLKAVFLDERDRDDVCQEMGITREDINSLLSRAKTVFRDVYRTPPASAVSTFEEDLPEELRSKFLERRGSKPTDLEMDEFLGVLADQPVSSVGLDIPDVLEGLGLLRQAFAMALFAEREPTSTQVETGAGKKPSRRKRTGFRSLEMGA